MCDDSNCPYFKLFIMKNKYKEDNDDSKPDYIFWIKTDILNNRKK